MISGAEKEGFTGLYLILCQSESYYDHRRVVGDPANQEAADDEKRHLRDKGVINVGWDLGAAFISMTLLDGAPPYDLPG